MTDENNWRNDYPDEDDLSPTGSYGDSEDEYHDEYRHRKTNYGKYARTHTHTHT